MTYTVIFIHTSHLLPHLSSPPSTTTTRANIYDNYVLPQLSTYASQTQLLPTLHAQLGLPPTALHDELSTLQQQLTQCIESQIDLRRKQVDGWMDKCALVEEECLRYGRALGGHLKSSGTSVGEIRKEQVLPCRFQLITDYQEKLRQVSLRARCFLDSFLSPVVLRLSIWYSWLWQAKHLYLTTPLDISTDC